jgi:hypothetical protein
MRKTLKNVLFGLFALLLMAGCMNVFDPPAITGGDAGGGTVILTLAGTGVTSDARTLLPADPVFTKYDVVFSRQGLADVTHTGIAAAEWSSSKTFKLAAGEWAVTVTGYQVVDGESEARAAASGSASLSVSDASPTPVTVELKPLPAGGKGIFAYDITLPEGPAVVTGAALTLKQGDAEKLNANLLEDPAGSEELDPGYYDLFLSLTDGEGGTYGEYHAAYIYSGMVTEFGTTEASVDLSALLFTSKTPAAASGNVVFNKTAVSHTPVTFTLTSSHTGTWNAYAAVSGGEALANVSLSFNDIDQTLTLEASGGVPAGDYWVSVTETGKAESLRLKLTLTDPRSSAPTADAAATEVKKTGVGAASVTFTLTSTHDDSSVWTAYTAAAGGVPLATITGTYTSANKELTLTETSGVGLTARTYYVAVAEPDEAESEGRLALTVIEGDLPIEVTYSVNTTGTAFVGIDNTTETLAEISDSNLAYPEINGLKVVNINSGTINLGSYAGGYFGESEWSMELSMKIPGLGTKFDVLVFHPDTGKNTAGTMRIESPANAAWIFFAYTGSSTPGGDRRISFAQPAANIWRHMTFVKSADDTLTVYLDGVQAAQKTGFTEFDNAAFKNITTVMLGGINNVQIYKYVIHKKALDPAGVDAALFAQAKADIDTLNTSAYVTFDPNDGNWEGSTTPVVVPVIKPATTVTPPPAPERGGYAFIGWNSQADGGGTIFDPAAPVTTNTIVYANWIDTTSSYSVAFDANGGEWDAGYDGNGDLDGDIVTVEKLFSDGSSLDTDMPDSAGLTRSDYTFAGWNTQADGGGAGFDGETSVVSAATTVYAVWEVSNPAAFLKLRHDFDTTRFTTGVFAPETGDSASTKGTPKNTGWTRGRGTYNEKTFYYFKTGNKYAMNNANVTYLDLGTGAGDILRAADKGYTMSTYVKIDGDWSGNGNFIWAFAETNNVGSNSGKAIWFSAPGSSHTTTTGGYGSNARNVSASGAVTREVWHHVAYTQKGKTGTGNAKLYVDGVLRATGTIPALPGDFNTLVHNALAGPCFQSDNNLSQTMFTDFRIYNEVLEADQIEGLAGDLADLKAVADWAPIADSSTPAASLPVVIKSADPQASVPFTLTTGNDGTWKVYDSPAGTQTVSGVTASFSGQELTLSTSGNDLDAGYYYVSVTESGKAESARLALRVRDMLPDLIFELDFGTETGTTTAAKGTTVLNGSIDYEDGITGKAGIFNGAAANYLAASDDDGESLLAGLKEFSAAFWLKQSDVNSWWFYAAPDTNAQVNNTPSYVGALFQKSSSKRFNIERYLNARSSSFTTATDSIPTDGTWKHIVLVFTETSYTAYIDGVQAGTSTTSIQPITGILQASPICYIGRANWGSGEGAMGSIDEYKIYSKALNATEINTLYTNENPSGGPSQSSGPVSFNFSGIPEDMSLSISTSSVQKTGSLAVSVQNPESYTDFEWWLDGVKQAESGGVYNVDVSSLSLGQHRVTAAALRGNVPCSARAAFTVIG